MEATVLRDPVQEIPFKNTVAVEDQQKSIEQVKSLIPRWILVRWEYEHGELMGTYRLVVTAPAESIDWIEKSFVLLATMACPKAEVMTWNVVT